MGESSHQVGCIEKERACRNIVKYVRSCVEQLRRNESQKQISFLITSACDFYVNEISNNIFRTVQCLLKTTFMFINKKNDYWIVILYFEK